MQGNRKTIIAPGSTLYFSMACALFLMLSFSGAGMSAGVDEQNQNKRRMIQESIRLYDGPCPCPYNIMKNGRKCGKRSAHSRPGGESPLCYPSDISTDHPRKDRKIHTWQKHGVIEK